MRLLQKGQQHICGKKTKFHLWEINLPPRQVYLEKYGSELLKESMRQHKITKSQE